jgi:hypothetical protein
MIVVPPGSSGSNGLCSAWGPGSNDYLRLTADRMGMTLQRCMVRDVQMHAVATRWLCTADNNPDGMPGCARGSVRWLCAG